MDKINTQKFNLGVKNNDTSKTEDVLGALFTIPEVIDKKKVNGKKVNELIVNPHIEKILISKKSSKNLGKLEIMYKNFFSNMPENESIHPSLKNHKAFDLNSSKIPNVLNLDVKSDKIFKINHVNKNAASKLMRNDTSKGLNLKINTINKNETSHENEINLLNIPKKSNSILKFKNNLNKTHNVKKSLFDKDNLKDIFSKLDRLKEDINSNNFENKMVFQDNEIIYKQLKANNESNNLSNHNDQINKVENSSLRNNSSQHQFNSDKNINFALDQMIEELDMSKLGWTEKLILRIEKGLKDDEKQIELALKPKELGNLKINLKIKDKSANIIMKVENAASMVALQTNEGLLTKTLLDQGFILDKINFENSLMSSNKENKNSSKDNKDNNLENNDKTIIDNVENNNDDNLNYLININA